jgi:transcriptional regulator with GAF, ATPase, and Fis domain
MEDRERHRERGRKKPVEAPPKGLTELHFEKYGVWRVTDAKRIMERAYIVRVLSMFGGNRVKTAEALGVTANNLQKRCSVLGIKDGKKRW